LFQLTFSGKSQNTMLIESRVFQSICFFGHAIWTAVHAQQVGVT